MRCEVAQQVLSALADGEALDDDVSLVRTHVRTCRECGRFEAGVARVRAQLRIDRVDPTWDLTAAVRTELEASAAPAAVGRPSLPFTASRRRVVAIAAAFVAGVLAGSLLVTGTGGRPSVAAADIPDLVLAAQHDVETLGAELTLHERGWHREVPLRTFAGTLSYAAPERLALHLDDMTKYPAGWPAGDIDVVIDGDRWWTRGLRSCPDVPQCIPAAPRAAAGRGREPFSAVTPAPLELVTPTSSFTLAGEPRSLGARRIDGQRAVGVAVTASQIAAVIAALQLTGNLRQVHPTDEAQVWLDAEHLVPLRVRVLATAGDDRRRWAASHGYTDEPGDVVIDLEWRAVEVNGDVADGVFRGAPAGAVTVDGGYARDPAPDALVVDAPLRLAGLGIYSSGTVAAGGAPVDVAAYTDGRAWLTVRATRGWPGGRLFGDLGDVVRRVELEGGRTAYISEDGTRVAFHSDDVDVVVTGSVAPERLRRAAAALAVEGRLVPAGWAEDSSTTLAAAAVEHPDVLVPGRVDGFGPPAVRLDDDGVTVSFAGPGSRGFLLTATAEDTLTPPLDPDARAVRVRSTTGRYSPARGELEWTEAASAYSLQSTTLPLGELLAIADGMAPVR